MRTNTVHQLTLTLLSDARGYMDTCTYVCHIQTLVTGYIVREDMANMRF